MVKILVKVSCCHLWR